MKNGDGMKEADFLIARPASDGKSQRFVLGETGFSFSGSDRPPSVMDTWTSGTGLPAGARDVLAKNPQFVDIVGLVGVPTGSHKQRPLFAGWILARASSGLVSVAIRDARDCTAGRLADDAQFATEAAQRFAAETVVILVQAATDKEAEIGRKALEKTFGTDVPELNRLYLSRRSSPPVWIASLSGKS
jgi:hypothetical protein